MINFSTRSAKVNLVAIAQHATRRHVQHEDTIIGHPVTVRIDQLAAVMWIPHAASLLPNFVCVFCVLNVNQLRGERGGTQCVFTLHNINTDDRDINVGSLHSDADSDHAVQAVGRAVTPMGRQSADSVQTVKHAVQPTERGEVKATDSDQTVTHAVQPTGCGHSE